MLDIEGRQQKKKWLASSDDLNAMYACFEGKPRISLWCDGKDPDNGSSSDEEREKPLPKRAKKKVSRVNSKLNEREDELESTFQQLKEKHGNNYSGPQLRLWARMIVAKTHSDMDEPPRVPMITGTVHKPQQKESLADAFASAATAIAKVFTPPSCSDAASRSQMHCSPSKKVDLRMKNLEQLHQLQQLLEDGILSQEEFASQKKIVLTSLDQLV